MPISAEEFDNARGGANQIEQLLRANPGKAYSLHEIEEEVIGKEMNRQKHLDIFIADLTVLTPLLFDTEKVQCKRINGVMYFRWVG